MQIFMLRKIRTTQPEMFSLWRKENSVLKYIRIIVLPSQDNNVIFSFSEIDEVFFFRPIATNGHLTQLRYNKVSQSVGRAGMRQVPLSRLNFLCHSLNILCRSCLNFLCCCFTGVFIAESDVGVGTIVGSAVFNILFIVGVCGLFAGMVSFPFLEKKKNSLTNTDLLQCELS